MSVSRIQYEKLKEENKTPVISHKRKAMAPSEMTPYDVSAIDRKRIFKKQNNDTFESVLGGNRTYNRNSPFYFYKNLEFASLHSNAINSHELGDLVKYQIKQ